MSSSACGGTPAPSSGAVAVALGSLAIRLRSRLRLKCSLSLPLRQWTLLTLQLHHLVHQGSLHFPTMIHLQPTWNTLGMLRPQPRLKYRPGTLPLKYLLQTSSWSINFGTCSEGITRRGWSDCGLKDSLSMSRQLVTLVIRSDSIKC